MDKILSFLGGPKTFISAVPMHFLTYFWAEKGVRAIYIYVYMYIYMQTQSDTDIERESRRDRDGEREREKDKALKRERERLGNGRNTVSRVLFRKRELAEFCGKLGEFTWHTNHRLRGTH